MCVGRLGGSQVFGHSVWGPTTCPAVAQGPTVTLICIRLRSCGLASVLGFLGGGSWGPIQAAPAGTSSLAEAKQPVNLCKPNPCMNEGTCILRNGSYRCECWDGREGPHCESCEWGSCRGAGLGSPELQDRS